VVERASHSSWGGAPASPTRHERQEWKKTSTSTTVVNYTYDRYDFMPPAPKMQKGNSYCRDCNTNSLKSRNHQAAGGSFSGGTSRMQTFVCGFCFELVMKSKQDLHFDHACELCEKAFKCYALALVDILLHVSTAFAFTLLSL
jgi:hypothetical protein